MPLGSTNVRSQFRAKLVWGILAKRGNRMGAERISTQS